MTETVFLLGAPGSALLALGAELDREPGVRALVPWNVGAMLARLQEATAHRASVWRGPLGRGGVWIDRAIELFAPSVVAALEARERESRGDLEVLALGHFELARRVELLAASFRDARFVFCASDGRIAASGRVPDSRDDVELALAGFDWAQVWSSAVAPVLGARGILGRRMIVLRPEDLVRAPDVEKVRLFEALGLRGVGTWRGTRPWTRAPLVGPALEGFACSRRACVALRALGYDEPAPGEIVARTPKLAAACIRGLLAERDLECAGEWLERTRSLGSVALLASVEGDFWSARGDVERAFAAWRRAIELDPEEPDAWTRIFADARRGEALEFAARARRASEPRIRFALARWLVARGLDAEAAELVAHVEHQPWPSTV